MRTLKIMLRVYARELRETLQLDDRKLDCLFPQLDSLLELHNHFLSRLRERRTESVQPGSEHNYAIHKLADILISQVHALNLVLLLHTFCSVFLASLFLLSPIFHMLPVSHFLSFASCFTYPVFTLLPRASSCCHTSCFTLPGLHFLLYTLSHFFPKLPASPFLF